MRGTMARHQWALLRRNLGWIVLAGTGVWFCVSHPALVIYFAALMLGIGLIASSVREE